MLPPAIARLLFPVIPDLIATPPAPTIPPRPVASPLSVSALILTFTFSAYAALLVIEPVPATFLSFYYSLNGSLLKPLLLPTALILMPMLSVISPF